MIDQLRQMAIFAKTVDHGSFRGAARELGISPSVVSHHLSKLESHLGVTLLYRSTRKLSLTREGERLLVATRNMLDAVEGELLAISGSAKQPSGEIRLTMPSVLAQSPLSNALAAFAIEHPRIKLLLDYSDMRKEIIGGGFDLAIRMGVNAKNSITSKILFDIERKLICSSQYFNQREKLNDPKQLKGWDWILLSPAQSRGFSLERGKHRVTLRPVGRIVSTDARAVYEFARAGVGVAAIPQFLASDDIRAKNMVSLLPKWQLSPLQAFAEWPTNAPKHGLVKLLLENISAACGG